MFIEVLKERILLTYFGTIIINNRIGKQESHLTQTN